MISAPKRRGIIGSLVLILLTFGLAAPSASAADLTKFDPGNIISDAVMYNGNDLSAPAVQAFLDSKAPRCVASPLGIPCLKNFRTPTSNKAADDRCNGYTGRASESAAEIVANVAQSCGISARALLVMLQKEQSLVTASGTNLTARRYEIAMGFGCPDGAPCDQQYYGFFNQVFRAAWQLESYRLYPARYGHRAGVVNNVRFSPTVSCGSSPVLIQNAATAGLYNYTPYQPNAAALAAGAGAGNACSSYGNRDFYANFVDWFGSPTFSVIGGIAWWYGQADNANRLGGPISNEAAITNGYWQAFEKGDLYLNAAGGWVVLGPLRTAYRQEAGPAGALGWPRSADSCPTTTHCLQNFDQGTIYTEWTAGTHAVIGPIAQLHASLGGWQGSLGLPLQGRTAAGSAWVQSFQGGRVFSSSTATAAVRGYLDSWYNGARSTNLGQPIANDVATSYGVRQQFANGSVHLTPSSATTVEGPFSTLYLSNGGDGGYLGRPLSNAVCSSTWCSQEFAGGRMYTAHGLGTWALTSPVSAAFDLAGGTTTLGFPTSSAKSSVFGGSFQSFQSGLIYSSGTQTVALKGYLAQWHGGEANLRGLGRPAENEFGSAGGTIQRFAAGRAYVAPERQAFAVLGAIDETYQAANGPSGALGWPTGSETCDSTGCFQQFQGGQIYRNANGATVLRGAMVPVFRTPGLSSRLGPPIAPDAVTASGVLQRFTKGTIFLEPTTWRATYGPIDSAYWRDGGTNSALGLPVAGDACPASNWCYQRFSGGTMYTAHGAGTWATLGPIDAYVNARGGVTNAGLGFPVGPQTSLGSSSQQSFQHGILTVDPQGVVSRS